MVTVRVPPTTMISGPRSVFSFYKFLFEAANDVSDMVEKAKDTLSKQTW